MNYVFHIKNEYICMFQKNAVSLHANCETMRNVCLELKLKTT